MEKRKLLKKGDKVRVTYVDTIFASDFTLGKIYEIGGECFEEDDCIGGYFSVVADDGGYEAWGNSPYVEIELVEEEKDDTNKESLAIYLLKQENFKLENELLAVEEKEVVYRKQISELAKHKEDILKDMESLNKTIKLLEETSGESQKD